ncbi:MAG: hypothetical protein LC792_15340, partial [Actinobacteria bacterium]|nr:hypothetical protein [Actinomycetota bacterium]
LHVPCTPALARMGRHWINVSRYNADSEPSIEKKSVSSSRSTSAPPAAAQLIPRTDPDLLGALEDVVDPELAFVNSQL